MDGDKNSRKKARFYLGFYSVIIIMRHMPSFRDVGNEGGRGGGHTPPTKIWAEQFTLSLNQGGQILPPKYYWCLQIFRPSDVLVFWRRAEQGRPGTFCSEGRGISDNSMKPELPSVLFDQNWLTPCQTTT